MTTKIPLKLIVKEKLSKLKDGEVYYVDDISKEIHSTTESLRNCIKRNFPNNYIRLSNRAFVGSERSIKNLLKRYNI